MSPATSVAGLREEATARVGAQLDAMAAAGVMLSAAERTLVDDAVRLAVSITAGLAGRLDPDASAGEERDAAGRRRVARHGELGGYSRHKRLGEEACGPCRAAASRARRPATPKALQPCGSYAAAQRHDKAGEPRCGPCDAAYKKYRRDLGASASARRGLEAAVWGVAA